MVIKETALQLEDAVLRPPCWQASVRLLCVSEQHSEPPPTHSREVCSLQPPGEDFHHSLTNFGQMSIAVLCRLCVLLQHFGTLYIRKINFFATFLFQDIHFSSAYSTLSSQQSYGVIKVYKLRLMNPTKFSDGCVYDAL